MDPITTTAAVLAVSNKILGKTANVISEDIAKLYEKGRDLIIEKARNKIKNLDDQKTSNLRISRDVFMNGSSSDNVISAEYFGGILASSRSDDGKDDSALYYLNIIKSLSSQQLKLHYIIYNSFNKFFIKNNISINVGLDTEIKSKKLFFSGIEFRDLNLNIDDLNILWQSGILSEYETGYEEKTDIYFIKVAPTTFGVIMYSIAHNKFLEWRNFSEQYFGDFENIEVLKEFSGKKDFIKKLKNSSQVETKQGDNIPRWG